jgi:xanthine dehydrogenase YagR molybdenum-binding subunit
MGIGMAMFEETVYDHRNGKPVNNNFADYMVPVNADIPELDCIFLDFPGTKWNEYGARGIGEIDRLRFRGNQRGLSRYRPART